MLQLSQGRAHPGGNYRSFLWRWIRKKTRGQVGGSPGPRDIREERGEAPQPWTPAGPESRLSPPFLPELVRGRVLDWDLLRAGGCRFWRPAECGFGLVFSL